MSYDPLPARRPSTPFGMREHKVGDAERSACAELLGEHFAAGRLAHADYEQRLRQAMVAGTNRDLARLTADLPPLGPPPASPPLARLVLAIVTAVFCLGGAALLGVIGMGMLIANAVNWPWMLLFSVLSALISFGAAMLAVRDARQMRASSKWMRRG